MKVFGQAFFKRIAGRGQIPRRAPQSAKFPGLQALDGLVDLTFAAGKLHSFALRNMGDQRFPFYNSIREADTF